MEMALHPLLNQGGTTKLERPSSLSRGGGFFIFRMLNQVSGGVLGEEASSPYHTKGTPSVFPSPAALLTDLFEHSVTCS
jgi:hypothetical protein